MNSDLGVATPDYADENVSVKVVKIMQSYTGAHHQAAFAAYPEFRITQHKRFAWDVNLVVLIVQSSLLQPELVCGKVLSAVLTFIAEISAIWIAVYRRRIIMTKYLIRFYLALCDVIPKFRKVTHKWMYQVMAHFLKQDQWTYMNYGYAFLNGDGNEPMLEPMDEPNRLSFQLYHHLASEVALQKKTILEVGSGRGGGASMIKKYHHPEKMIGLDYSGIAVKLCNKNHGREGLSFVEGDAENLPFSQESFDAVINVESSHCYESMKCFLSEVYRVLKPEGHFLYTDLRCVTEMEVLEKLIGESRLNVIKKTDITLNVIKALGEDHERRMQEISKSVPKPFIKQFREFAGVKDSVVYKQFESRNSVYFSYVMVKG